MTPWPDTTWRSTIMESRYKFSFIALSTNQGVCGESAGTLWRSVIIEWDWILYKELLRWIVASETCIILHIVLTAYLLVDGLWHIGLFLGTVSKYERCFCLTNTPQGVDIKLAILSSFCVLCSCIHSVHFLVRNSAISSFYSRELFRHFLGCSSAKTAKLPH